MDARHQAISGASAGAAAKLCWVAGRSSARMVGTVLPRPTTAATAVATAHFEPMASSEGAAFLAAGESGFTFNPRELTYVRILRIKPLYDSVNLFDRNRR